MKLSLYTFVKDGLFYDFHVVDMLKHHLPLVDEIVVNEGFSSDGTFEAIASLHPKIRIIRNQLDKSEPKSWSRKAKDQARRACTGDWCVLMDCDEFLPEWEFDRLRQHMEHTDKHVLSATYKHFYGNYRVQYERPDRPFPPRRKWIIHRNREDVEIFGDGSDVRIPALGESAKERDATFECHHFGEVRDASRLRQKWHIQGRRNMRNSWSWIPGLAFKVRPHDWLDGDFLQHLKVYEGPYIKAVRDNPDEFVRDEFVLYRRLTANT